MLYFLKPAPPPPTGCSNTPKDGSLNLRSNNPPYPTFQVRERSYAKTTGSIPAKYSEVKYDADSYGGTCEDPGADECDDNENPDVSSLIYDVYYPDTYANYATCPLPAVILFHAGGFMECSNFRQPGIETICQELAKRGYVAFSVEYRRGRIKDEDNTQYTSVQQQLAVYRACQDARGAIRSIIKRQINHSSFSNDDYQIDINSIFVGGMSAGGVAAMSAAWYTENMVYDVFSSITTPTGATIKQALGDINLNAYYGEPTIPYHESIIGTVNMWGSIAIPVINDIDEYNFIETTAFLKPHIGFHGIYDEVFPYYDNASQYVYFSDPPQINDPEDYNSENFCIDNTQGSYTLEGDENTPDLINGSSLNMHKILNYYEINNELYVDCNMKHGLDKNCGTCSTCAFPACYTNCNNCVFDSDFGTGATNTTQVSIYMAQRIAVFFQAILVGIDQNLVNYEFVECENTRKKCETNPACSNTACDIE